MLEVLRSRFVLFIGNENFLSHSAIPTTSLHRFGIGALQQGSLFFPHTNPQTHEIDSINCYPKEKARILRSGPCSYPMKHLGLPPNFVLNYLIAIVVLFSFTSILGIESFRIPSVNSASMFCLSIFSGRLNERENLP